MEEKTYNRRLTDKILICVHAACDLKELILAQQLLVTLDGFVQNSPYQNKERRKLADLTVAAHERLWTLRHGASVPNAEGTSTRDSSAIE